MRAAPRSFELIAKARTFALDAAPRTFALIAKARALVRIYMARLLETGQETCYSVWDDGDYEIGVDKAYTVETLGDYAGNSDIEVAHYASNQITFTAIGNIVADGAGGMVTFLAGDTVVIKGSANNDGVFTVAVGGVAGQFTTIEAIVNEGPGAYISFYKRTAHSNNAVQDDQTGLMWSRNTSVGERVGELSNGTLDWYDAVGSRFPLYAIANTVSCIMPGNIFRVIGGAALTQFHQGDMIQCAGFVNPVNNLPNMYVVSATPNGADLDILVDSGEEVLIAEGAVGDTIYLVCRSIFAYMAGARLAGLSNLTDWRVPNWKEAESLLDHEAPTAYPDAVSFPAWPAYVWTGTTYTFAAAFAMFMRYDRPLPSATAKTAVYITALVRG